MKEFIKTNIETIGLGELEDIGDAEAKGFIDRFLASKREREDVRFRFI